MAQRSSTIHELITGILLSLKQSPIQASSSFLSDPAIKSTLLTLHCIFPDQFLPALDLLERGKITTFRASNGSSISCESEAEGAPYYVEASSSRSNRFSQAPATQTFYEVRLKAWNCSCPAFAFAACDGELGVELTSRSGTSTMRREAQYGGLADGDKSTPACKHLLACLLAEYSLYLRSLVQTQDMTVEEIAAWTAGWVP